MPHSRMLVGIVVAKTHQYNCMNDVKIWVQHVLQWVSLQGMLSSAYFEQNSRTWGWLFVKALQ